MLLSYDDERETIMLSKEARFVGEDRKCLLVIVDFSLYSFQFSDVFLDPEEFELVLPSIFMYHLHPNSNLNMG